MIPFIEPKSISYDIFEKYLKDAEHTNQYTNYGSAVKLLESRARKELQIPNDYAIIACCNATAGLQTIYSVLEITRGKQQKATQAFTFPSSFLGDAKKSEVYDLDYSDNINLKDRIKANIVTVTNVFGHVQELETILNSGYTIVFDNAATPFSFFKGKNTCSLGFASVISLHHTKPLGFGEGGLIIINRQHEKLTRALINFGNGNFVILPKSSNSKMSELSAAGILQYWDTNPVEAKKETYCHNYFNLKNKLLNKYKGRTLNNYSDKNGFFPSCLPFVFDNENEADPSLFPGVETRKYYKPLLPFPNSYNLYSRILCFPIYEMYDV